MLAIPSAAAAAPEQKASPPTEERPEAEPPVGMTRIGWDESAIWVSERSRQRVRGDRPDGASIHVAFAPPVRDPDAELRHALARFEANTLAEDAAIPRRTIVGDAPEPWMAELSKPAFPVRWNGRLIEFLNYFKNDPKGQRLAAAWMKRVGRYEVQIRRILRELGVPEDLIYVAMVESGLNPGARSGVGAAGLWQFMEATGRVYGLESAYWYDDRLAIEKSTYAAAAYLKDLHTRFGSWELALAAYNAGYGLVVKSIRENNTNNYWALCEIENGLPTQTVNYVAKIVAVSLVAHNRDAFGVGEERAPAIVTATVDVPPGTRVADVAKALGLEKETLERLNARLVRGRTAPSGADSRMQIPRDSVAKFETLGAKLRATQQDYSTYTARLGESLGSIASRYGITERKLRRLNAIHDSGEIDGGTVLVVPKIASATSDSPPGENPLKPLVAVPALAIPQGKRLVFFRVTRASTPRLTAAAFDVSWDEIVRWNDLDPQARLVDGQYLQLLVDQSFDADAARVRVLEVVDVVYVLRGSQKHLDAVLERRDMRRRGYKVKKGDTMARVAKRFKMSQGSLARINGVRRDHRPEVGKILVVYVATGKTGGTTTAPEPVPTSLTTELGALAEFFEESDAPSTANSAGVPGDGSKTGPSEKQENRRREASTAETSKLPGKRKR
jgi:membrane-bound lytic murein transglycosylase D